MSKKYICDRCGKEVGNGEVSDFSELCFYGCVPDLSASEWDLCKDCTREVVNFLKKSGDANAGE